MTSFTTGEQAGYLVVLACADARMLQQWDTPSWTLAHGVGQDRLVIWPCVRFVNVTVTFGVQLSYQRHRRCHAPQQLCIRVCSAADLRLLAVLVLAALRSYTSSTPHSRLLLQALVQLAGPHTLIFLALSLHHNPEEVHAFLEWAESDWGFAVQRVTDGVPAEYVVPDVLVVRLRLLDVQKAQQTAAAAADGTLRRKDEEQ